MLYGYDPTTKKPSVDPLGLLGRVESKYPIQIRGQTCKDERPVSCSNEDIHSGLLVVDYWKLRYNCVGFLRLRHLLLYHRSI